MGDDVVMSSLPKTWIFDLDGTLVRHNGYLTDGRDTLLPGAREYLDTIPDEDFILILTSRTEQYRALTCAFLKEEGIRYDQILFNMPLGERIVVNDRKPSGLDMAFAFNLKRDELMLPEIRRER